MSDYKIVNRVHPTPAFAQTMAEVEAQVELEKAIPLVKEVIQNPGVLEGLKAEFHVPVPKVGDEMKIPFHAGETIKFVPSAENVGKLLTSQVESFDHDAVLTAEASRAPFVGKAETIKFPEPETFNQMVSRMAEELGCADPVVKQSEFEDFKERVIRAFKDMGFDTRKFFDE